MARRFVSVSIQVSLVVLVALVLGIGAVTFYLTRSLTLTIRQETNQSLNRESTLVYEAIEQLMLPGQAPLVVDYFNGITDSDQRFTIRLYRSDGTGAFTDNATITEVNERLGARRFKPRPEDQSGVSGLPVRADDPAFQQAVSIPAHGVTRYTRTSEQTIVQLYEPLINLPKCVGCHGSDHTIRGVIDIQADITDAVRREQIAIATSSGGFVLLVLVIGLFTTSFMRRKFVRPMQEIQGVCVKVTDGDFDQRTTIDRNDEIGILARTVNTMVEGLHERFVLGRFVSSSTLESLRGSTESREETVALLFSDIRGFTAYTESQEPGKVVETLNHVLSVQTSIISRHGGDVDKYVGDEVVAVFFGDQCVHNGCAAAAEIQRTLAEDGSTTTAANPIHVGIGVHYGPVVIGQIGSEERADFTAIGDNVNVAARLCTAAGRDEILVSNEVAVELRTRDEANAGALDGPYRLSVKGKAEPLRVYKLEAMHMQWQDPQPESADEQPPVEAEPPASSEPQGASDPPAPSEPQKASEPLAPSEPPAPQKDVTDETQDT